MAELPKTMKAWTITRLGKPKDVLRLDNHSPVPSSPKAGEVMIRVSYAAINPGDFKLMETWIPFRLEATPGMDFVGEVVQVGHYTSLSTPNFHIGMIVAGAVPVGSIFRGAGTLAEYIVIDARAVVEKPSGLTEAVAAGVLGIAGQTSAAVLRTAHIHAGDRILLNGASGGVASILIQALCGIGARVTGVCSARNEAFVRKLGAEEVVDYTAHEDLYGHLASICNPSTNGPFDAIIDCVGNMELCYKSPKYLKTDGEYVTLEGSFLQQVKLNYFPLVFGGFQRTYKSIMTYPSGSLANAVIDWVGNGWIKEFPVDSEFSMDEVIEAFERQATGRARGKILVKVLKNALN